jgi:putative holliday junction resolvase
MKAKRTFQVRLLFLAERKGTRRIMKIIALDVGDKTIGVALSDDLLITAQGLMTIERVGARKDAGKVMELIEEHHCDTVLVGLPMNLNGTNSIQTDKVYEFKTMLENKMKSNGMSQIRILFEDERFTTLIAEKVLIEADVSRRKRKDVIDKQAAVVILQGYLERQRNLRKEDDGRQY